MSDTWWIPKQKQYLPETVRWYCGTCDRRTPIERNPDWNGEFEGERPAPEWLVRCLYCKTKHWQDDGYSCPNCGWDNLPEWGEEKPKELIEMGASYPTRTMEYSNCFDWDETWKCPKCRNVFTFTNGNC